MADTFNFLPDDGPSGDIKMRIMKTQFGDGYAQVIPDGLNVKFQVWPLKFDRAAADILPIKQFLDAHIGISFNWTPPVIGAVQGLYLCTGYNNTPRSGGQETLSFTLEQIFVP
jgi:phage-related protein